MGSLCHQGFTTITSPIISYLSTFRHRLVWYYWYLLSSSTCPFWFLLFPALQNRIKEWLNLCGRYRVLECLGWHVAFSTLCHAVSLSRLLVCRLVYVLLLTRVSLNNEYPLNSMRPLMLEVEHCWVAQWTAAPTRVLGLEETRLSISRKRTQRF